MHDGRVSIGSAAPLWVSWSKSPIVSDVDGVIAAVDEGASGLVRLKDGTEFERPKLVRLCRTASTEGLSVTIGDVETRLAYVARIQAFAEIYMLTEWSSSSAPCVVPPLPGSWQPRVEVLSRSTARITLPEPPIRGSASRYLVQKRLMVGDTELEDFVDVDSMDAAASLEVIDLTPGSEYCFRAVPEMGGKVLAVPRAQSSKKVVQSLVVPDPGTKDAEVQEVRQTRGWDCYPFCPKKKKIAEEAAPKKAVETTKVSKSDSTKSGSGKLRGVKGGPMMISDPSEAVLMPFVDVLAPPRLLQLRSQRLQRDSAAVLAWDMASSVGCRIGATQVLVEEKDLASGSWRPLPEHPEDVAEMKYTLALESLAPAVKYRACVRPKAIPIFGEIEWSDLREWQMTGVSPPVLSMPSIKSLETADAVRPFVLTWEAPPHLDCAIAEYIVETSVVPRATGQDGGGEPVATSPGFERAASTKTTEVTIDGVAGASVECRVQVTTDAADLISAWSNVVSVVLPYLEAPAQLHSEALGTDTISLKWEPPPSAIACVVSKYELEWRDEATGLADGIKDCVACKRTITDLAREHLYSVRVRALADVAGSSPWSEAVTVQLPVPKRPEPPGAAAQSRTSLEIQWSRPEVTACRIVSFEFQCCASQPDATQPPTEAEWEALGTKTVAEDARTLVWSGLRRSLDPETTAPIAESAYVCRMRALTDLGGETPWSMASQRVTLPDVGVPAMPRLEVAGESSAKASWAAPATAACNAEKYELELLEDGATSPMRVDSTSALTLTFDGLKPGSSYTCKVRAIGGGISGAPELKLTSVWSQSSSQLAIPLAPAIKAPTGLQVSTVSWKSALLRWKESEAQRCTVARYTIRWQTADGKAVEKEHAQLDKLEATLDQLVPGVTYDCSVRAVPQSATQMDPSDWCAPESVALPYLASPWPLRVGLESTTSIRVRWETPKHGHCQLSGYEVQMAEAGTSAWRDIGKVLPDIDDTSVRVAGESLALGSSFIFRARAAAATLGPSEWSPETESVTVPKLAPPAAPILSIGSSQDTAKVVWKAREAIACSAQQYEVELFEDDATSAIRSESTSALTLTFYALEPGSSYTCKVRAIGGGVKLLDPSAAAVTLISGWSEAGSVALPAPPNAKPKIHTPAAPRLAVAADSPSSIAVNWIAPAAVAGSVDSYEVDLFEGSATSPPLRSESTEALNLTFDGLKPGSSYTCKVRAIGVVVRKAKGKAKGAEERLESEWSSLASLDLSIPLPKPDPKPIDPKPPDPVVIKPDRDELAPGHDDGVGVGGGGNDDGVDGNDSDGVHGNENNKSVNDNHGDSVGGDDSEEVAGGVNDSGVGGDDNGGGVGGNDDGGGVGGGGDRPVSRPTTAGPRPTSRPTTAGRRPDPVVPEPEVVVLAPRVDAPVGLSLQVDGPVSTEEETLSKGQTQLKVAWAAAEAENCKVTSYVLRLSSNGGATWEVERRTNETLLVVKGLIAGLEYSCTVCALTDAGVESEWAAPKMMALPRLAAPRTPVTTVLPGMKGVRVTWEEVDAVACTVEAYVVQLSEDGGGTWLGERDCGTALTETILESELKKGVSYSCRVCARVGGPLGRSTWSGRSEADFPSVGKPSVIVKLKSQMELLLEWAAAESISCRVLAYEVEWREEGQADWQRLPRAQAAAAGGCAAVPAVVGGTQVHCRVRSLASYGGGAGGESSDEASNPTEDNEVRSEWSVVRATLPQLEAPPLPTLKPRSSRQLMVSWEQVGLTALREKLISSYILEYAKVGTASALGAVFEGEAASSTTTSESIPRHQPALPPKQSKLVSPLAGGATYDLRVRSEAILSSDYLSGLGLTADEGSDGSRIVSAWSEPARVAMPMAPEITTPQVVALLSATRVRLTWGVEIPDARGEDEDDGAGDGDGGFAADDASGRKPQGEERFAVVAYEPREDGSGAPGMQLGDPQEVNARSLDWSMRNLEQTPQSVVFTVHMLDRASGGGGASGSVAAAFRSSAGSPKKEGGSISSSSIGDVGLSDQLISSSPSAACVLPVLAAPTMVQALPDSVSSIVVNWAMPRAVSRMKPDGGGGQPADGAASPALDAPTEPSEYELFYATERGEPSRRAEAKLVRKSSPDVPPHFIDGLMPKEKYFVYVRACFERAAGTATFKDKSGWTEAEVTMPSLSKPRIDTSRCGKTDKTDARKVALVWELPEPPVACELDRFELFLASDKDKDKNATAGAEFAKFRDLDSALTSVELLDLPTGTKCFLKVRAVGRLAGPGGGQLITSDLSNQFKIEMPTIPELASVRAEEEKRKGDGKLLGVRVTMAMGPKNALSVSEYELQHKMHKLLPLGTPAGLSWTRMGAKPADAKLVPHEKAKKLVEALAAGQLTFTKEVLDGFKIKGELDWKSCVKLALPGGGEEWLSAKEPSPNWEDDKAMPWVKTSDKQIKRTSDEKGAAECEHLLEPSAASLGADAGGLHGKIFLFRARAKLKVDAGGAKAWSEWKRAPKLEVAHSHAAESKTTGGGYVYTAEAHEHLSDAEKDKMRKELASGKAFAGAKGESVRAEIEARLALKRDGSSGGSAMKLTAAQEAAQREAAQRRADIEAKAARDVGKRAKTPTGGRAGGGGLAATLRPTSRERPGTSDGVVSKFSQSLPSRPKAKKTLEFLAETGGAMGEAASSFVGEAASAISGAASAVGEAASAVVGGAREDHGEDDGARALAQDSGDEEEGGARAMES